ncbi:ATPase components of ABC transporters with duplicated ATPase domains [Dyadobacter koreensis]|uniref:ATPase components of ABC transporters with duplicated ATPase domains n=1 Tax=Dyadobacter koreensis TaxID=408657 RepID=A0A1H6YRR5_9BACT|nr:ABC-F family ATP-binding cassette domain-containing protein [Dyadobacter koreensis]SEJ40010.1 ATPase components of ABC transporters with duplicated ATPase domains [Dyadobacter koreensis]
MLILQNITYIHQDKDLLFGNINLTVNRQDKIALIGNNGSGKSTLLKILAGLLKPAEGTVKSEDSIYYVPQIFGQFNDHTIAQALNIDKKIKALREILDGRMTEANLAELDDDWTISERSDEALSHWKLEHLDLSQRMESLSGGQKTKVFLAGILIHKPEIVLLDEPSNHLDNQSRTILYDYIRSTNNTLIVVSHDRKLLNILDTVYELSKKGISVYGGNYDFYAAQKNIEISALNETLRNKEKELRKAKEIERESLERQHKLDARGKKKQEKAGLPTIVMNTLKNNAERSTSRMKDIHAVKVDAIAHDLSQLRGALPDVDKMKMGFDNSSIHKGKILVTAENINAGYNGGLLWKTPLDFQLISGSRISIQGVNGSGKTTLIKIILGQMIPRAGVLHRTENSAVYIDQDYSLIDNSLNVYEQAQQFNSGILHEHDIKIRLNRFLFGKNDWNKQCVNLSGGEKMRLMLCCLTISNQAPDIIILDEPTNNLDIQNIEILTAAINEYQGTLLVVSHDSYFLEQINIEKVITLN